MCRRLRSRRASRKLAIADGAALAVRPGAGRVSGLRTSAGQPARWYRRGRQRSRRARNDSGGDGGRALDTEVLTIAAWNVNALRARLPLVLRYLDGHDIDVLCLQETRVPAAAFPRQPFADRGYQLAIAGDGSYAGVAIASRLPIRDQVAGVPGHDEPKAPGRRLAVRLDPLWVDTVYVPTRRAIGKVEFLDALRADYLARFAPGSPVVLAGDFNICFDKRDLASPTLISDPELHPARPEDLAWRRLLEVGLVDAFRHRIADAGHYSWFPPARWALTRNYGMRLDYLFATAPVLDTLVDVSHDRETRTWDRPSDHLPVRARFALG
jgi:exodeoxyribonuclease-3